MKRRLIALPLCLLLCLLLVAGAQAQVNSIKIKYTKVTMTAGKSATMPISVKPAAERANVTWTSSDAGIATVSKDGIIRALKPGVAVIRVKATGGNATAQCRVTVKPAPVTSVSLNQTRVTAAKGSNAQLSATLAPVAAAGSALKWSTSNKKVATVTSAGKVALVGTGTATITATAPSGKKAKCTFTVSQSQEIARRAMVIGESRKSFVWGLTELPNVPTDLAGVAAMFKFNGIPTTTVQNSTNAKLFSSIQSTFAGAKANDVSYVYILCHGGFVNNTYRIFASGDGFITPAQLRSALDKVPGRVVLLLGSCYGGTVISKGAGGDVDMAQAFIDAFTGTSAKSGEFIGDKYQVLCASTSTEEGIGVTSTYKGKIVEDGTYSFFGKALMEGGRGDADANKDGKTTLSELHAFANRRVKALYNEWEHLMQEGDYKIQNVVCYPASSNFVLF